MANPKPNLFADLRARKEKERENAVDWEKLRSEWIVDVSDLISKVQQWLAPGVVDELVNIEQVPARISEEHLGTYAAPALRIEMAGGDVVLFEPVGALIIGAMGRIDLSCGPKRATILRTKPGEWKFKASLVPTGRSGPGYIDVTEETFTEALRELIQ